MPVKEPSMDSPLISVVIPTCNRAGLLRPSLESLACQSLPTDRFEVVVVDDGSTDETRDVCLELSTRMPLKYFYIENSGISAAKNLGVFASVGSILVFFDDDDVAHPHLLREHLRIHQQYPDENAAVLGYTEWAPRLRVTELMHFVTEVGCFLFSYPNLADGQILDFTYFWGGRSSCKRSFLIRQGVFNQLFRFGSEDVELGYRLSQYGLKVIFNRAAVQYMNRAITFEEFCRRCETQGYSQFHFSKLHSEDSIQRYCQVGDARTCWNRLENDLGIALNRVREIEELIDCQPNSSDIPTLRSELHKLYAWTFNAFKKKGIVKAEDEAPAATDLFISMSTALICK
jgi:GT2 family glycosyltransferase